MSDKFERDDQSVEEVVLEAPSAPEHWVLPVLFRLGVNKPLLNSTVISIATRMEADMKLSKEDIIAEIRHYGVEEFIEKYKAGSCDSRELHTRWAKGTRRIKAPDLSGISKPRKRSESGLIQAVRGPAPEPQPDGMLTSIKEMARKVVEGWPGGNDEDKSNGGK